MTGTLPPPPRNAIERLLTEEYPVVHRMALALTGRSDLGSSVTRMMMKRGLALASRSVHLATPRWFEHHTVLATRQTALYQPDLHNESLVSPDLAGDAPYTAFIRAIRGLHFQQREAFILHHGGQFDYRRLATAMDCSTEAAANHLRVADQSMRQLAGGQFDAFVSQMKAAYEKLLPDAHLYLPAVQNRVRRYLRVRRLLRLVGWLILLALLAAASFAGWWVYQRLDL
ncbi:MAG: hypothetical protein IT447_04685 [Phycisphaerales bacterium]|nr:hypothetical protein [Phycisphaerales bacterium]